MEDGELDYSNQDAFPNMVDSLLSSCSMDSFLDDILNDTHACSHTHTCNPPGPDLSHTHTCFHVHTKILPATAEDKVGCDETSESNETKSKKRPLGNREAVRKYREKKKARAASLEDEVVRLRAINQRLLKKLQGQAALEAEIARLKCLLVDIRGRIEGEIESFPYQKSTKGVGTVPNIANRNYPVAYMTNPCDLRCDDQVYCMHPGLLDGGAGAGAFTGQGFGMCDIGGNQCTTSNSDFQELTGSPCGDNIPAVNVSVANKRAGGTRGSRIKDLPISPSLYDIRPAPVLGLSCHFASTI